MRSNVRLSTFFKAQRLGCIQLRRGSRGAPIFEWVNALQAQLAAVVRLLARLCQAQRVHRAQTHDAESAGPFPAEDPALRATDADLQEQPTSVAIKTAVCRVSHT